MKMGSWWLGLWNIVGAVWGMILDVAQFWKEVSVVFQTLYGMRGEVSFVSCVGNGNEVNE